MIPVEQFVQKQNQKNFELSKIYERIPESDPFDSSSNQLKLIINNYSLLSMRQQARQKANEKDCIQIMSTLEDELDSHQYWMIKPLSQKQLFQIVHFRSDNVIDCENQKVKLRRGREDKCQIFTREKIAKQMKIRNDEDNYIARFKAYNGMYLSLQGTLTLMDFEEQNEAQIFRVKKVEKKVKELEKYCFIADPIKNLCLDVANGSKNPDAEICLWPVNCRANQYWNFSPAISQQNPIDTTYSIKNYLSGLFMTVKDEKLVQTNDRTPMWQLKKLSKRAAELYCIKNDKHLEKGQDRKFIFTHDIGKIWKFI